MQRATDVGARIEERQEGDPLDDWGSVHNKFLFSPRLKRF